MTTPKIREDVFDGMSSITRTMDEVRTEYLRDTQEALRAVFPDFDEAVRFVNRLDTKETARLFLEMGRFYWVSKKHVELSVLKFALVISIIEKIQSHGKSFVAPLEFLIQKKNIESHLKAPIPDIKGAMALIRAATDQYNAEYGITRKVVEFFQEYASLDDKILLAKSLKVGPINYVVSVHSEDARVKAAKDINDLAGTHKIEKGELPSCYNWRACWIQYGQCYPEVSCDLKKDATLLARTIKKLAQLLYQWRSKFTHECDIPPISDTTFITSTEDGIIVNDISVELFQSVFERAFKNYFEKHLIAPPASTAGAT